MSDFTPQATTFAYKAGSKLLSGTIEIAPCTLDSAKHGDRWSLGVVCSAVARELRMQDPSFLSKVEWRKIKWTE